MNLTVKKLTSELGSDYIEFFDNNAFSDGSDFAGCYCTWYHWTDDLENERSQCSKEVRKHFKKELAKKYIQQGILQGYLAYSDGKVVGWCNVNDRGCYDRINEKNRPDLWEDFVVADRVKSIVCFVVTPNMRGKGIATALLKTLCADAKINNYSYIEAYPSLGAFKERNYHGPFSMYEKLGFILQDNRAGDTVVRKYM